jgi:hypothetical protein
MAMTNAELKRRLFLGSAVILLAGLCSALLIYAIAEDVPDDSLGYAIVNGAVYPLATADSKLYRRELQRFGGKTALLIDDFSRWFSGLWHGKALAKTVASISIFLSLAIYLFANSIASGAKSDSQDAGNRDEPG